MTRSAERDGIAAALAAYTLWGLVPIFFRQLDAVPALEIIAHRVVWSLLLVGALLLARQCLGAVWNAARDPRILARAALAFAAIWAGLALYTADMMLQHRPR